MENTKSKSHVPDVYILSDHDSQENLINHQKSPSPLIHLTANKTFSISTSSPPPPPPLPLSVKTKKVTISKEKDEIQSNYDSDDGWSDDSAELLYVDERYATEKRKMTPSSHLPSHPHYHYQLQQQNVLLQ